MAPALRLTLALVFAALALAIPAPGSVSADAGLASAVAAAYFPRYEDAGLHTTAHERVGEIAACGCLDHAAIRQGTAEVLAFNAGHPNAIAAAVAEWAASPAHNAILGNRGYGRIGCAEAVVNGTHWFACVLAAGPLPPRGLADDAAEYRDAAASVAHPLKLRRFPMAHD